MKRKAWRGLAVIIAAFVLLAAIMHWSRRGGETRSLRHADGTQVGIRNASFGTKHRFVDGAAWQRMLSNLPTNFLARLGIVPRVTQSKTPSLMIWLEWEFHSNQFPYPQWLRVVDSHGLASRNEQSTRTIQRSNNTALTAFQLTSLPRHEEFIGLELRTAHRTAPNAQEVWGIFKIRNPAFKRRFTGALSSGDTAEVHGEKFTLLSINTGLEATGTLAGMTLSNQWTEFAFQIGTNQPAQLGTNITAMGDWSIQSVELTDDDGNYIRENAPQGRYIPMGQQYMMRKNDGIVLIPGSIWPGPLWHVRAEFRRNPTPSLDAAHRWTTLIPLPRESEPHSLSMTGYVENCQITLKAIERPPGKPPILHLHFSSEPAGSDLRVLGVVDQNGNAVTYRYLGLTKPERGLELRSLPEATEVKVTFAVLHSVVAEFTGSATILRTNVARW